MTRSEDLLLSAPSGTGGKIRDAQDGHAPLEPQTLTAYIALGRVCGDDEGLDSEMEAKIDVKDGV